VRYDRDTRWIVIDLKNGSTFIFPPRLVEGLAGASPEEIAEVELGPRGAALFWRNLDQHSSLAGLTAGIFGSKAWMVEHLRKAGSVKSRAKAAAARANGAKGAGRLRDEPPRLRSHQKRSAGRGAKSAVRRHILC
jgi:hypothetical protein